MAATTNGERRSFDHSIHGVGRKEHTSPIPMRIQSESLKYLQRRRISASERKLYASYESFNYEPTENQLLERE